MRSQIENRKSQIVIVGAGPAGSSLAIRLALRGLGVTLIEKDRFPREKLCGEFISPECFRHFEALGIKGELLAMGGDRVAETRFFSRTGRSVSVPTVWFGQGDFALSLSRAQMDDALLRAARRAGVCVIEGSRLVGAMADGGRILSLDLRADTGERLEVSGETFIDATGRAAVLSRLADVAGPKPVRPNLVAFKAHLTGVEAEPGVCEIYFFDGGYGGLSHVEEGKANFCFILRADRTREFIGNTNRLFRSMVSENSRAEERLSHAEPVHDWLAVAVGDFGRRKVPSLENLVSVGDAGAFIDPFTGSGMLMALESSELLSRFLGPGGFRRSEFLAAHRRLFERRLRVSGVLRRAAFMPRVAGCAIRIAGVNDALRSMLAKATRAGSRTG